MNICTLRADQPSSLPHARKLTESFASKFWSFLQACLTSSILPSPAALTKSISDIALAALMLYIFAGMAAGRFEATEVDIRRKDLTISKGETSKAHRLKYLL